MKKSELKKIIKPIVEECIRETLFQEGILSSIISEVMVGISDSQTAKPVLENKNTQTQSRERINNIKESKKKLMDEIGREAFGGVDLFEGTSAAPAQSGASSHGALKGMDPNDPGVNIDGLMNIMGQTWRTLAKGK